MRKAERRTGSSAPPRQLQAPAAAAPPHCSNAAAVPQPPSPPGSPPSAAAELPHQQPTAAAAQQPAAAAAQQLLLHHQQQQQQRQQQQQQQQQHHPSSASRSRRPVASPAAPAGVSLLLPLQQPSWAAETQAAPAAEQPAGQQEQQPKEPHLQQPDAHAAAESPVQRPAGAFVADETEAALRTLILGAVQSIQELKGVTSSEMCDHIQAAHEAAVAMQAEVAADAEELAPRPAASGAAEAWVRVGGRRGGTSAARPSAVKALLQRSSLHELLAVLKASHQFVEVKDPRDTAVPQQLAKAYRLHARAKVPSAPELAAAIRTLLRAEPTPINEGPVETQLARAVGVQQAKFALLVSSVAALTEAGCASAGRIREVLALAGPPTLAAWLGHKRPQMLQRYCLARLAKDCALEMKDLGQGQCQNLVRYRVAGPPPPPADLKAAHRVLKRVAREEAPPRHVPPPHKRACTGGAAAAAADGVGPELQQPRCGPAAAAGLRTGPAAAAAGGPSAGGAGQPGAAAANAGVAAGSSVTERLLRRIEEHHAMLAPVMRHH